MEHTPENCPNKRAIEENKTKLVELLSLYHTIDKATDGNIKIIQTQYTTIIDLITTQSRDYKELSTKVYHLEREMSLNNYKTNKTTDFFDKVTWSVIAKVFALIGIVGAIIASTVKL